MTAIICAVDGSSGSSDALATAAELARRAHAQLLVVHVHDGDEHAMDEQSIEDTRRMALGVAADQLDRLDAGIDATCIGLVGAVGPRLADLAHERDGIAIVLGARTRGNAGTTFRSRTAKHVTESTDVPVLVAPMRPATRLHRESTPETLARASRTRLGRRKVRAWAESSKSVRPRPSLRS
jgi:nucleotide-binding universal stress UspA family protein